MSNKDFVSRYTYLLSGITDAPLELLEASALFLLSTAVGRKWVFYTAPEASLFDDKNSTKGKYLNLWFLFLGKSRISRKTTVIRKAEEFIERIHVSVLPNVFTPEYLVTELSKISKGGETHATWIQDECSAFFNLLTKKDSYLTSADAILCTLYDCKTYTRGTQQRGKEEVSNPYLTALLASTEDLPACFEDRMIKQGFPNRFGYVLGEKRYKPLRTEPLTEEEKKEAEELSKFLESLSEKKNDTFLVMSEEAKNLFQEFERKVEEKIEKENFGLKEGYCGNLPNFAIKFACLYRIARMPIEEIQSCEEVKIEKQDLEKAIEYCKKLWKNFEKVLELRMRHNVRRKPAITESADIERVYLIIKEEGTISRSDLLQKSGLKSDELDKIVITLKESERIEEIIEKTKGRAKRYYRCLK